MTASDDLLGMLGVALAARASDVHLTAKHPARMRVDGDLEPIPGYEGVTPPAWIESAVGGLLSSDQYEEFSKKGEVDLSYNAPGVARFRVNVFRQLGEVAAALRFINEKAIPLEELGVPLVAADLVKRPRGLVLVTGPTGSGKSTTLAAMIDIVNRTMPSHIITVEDPIEFQHTSKMSLVHQREIGSDTASFSEALRRILRQDPDVILVGELRDPESISTALSAAETGHLVLSTLHTQSAAKSINRIIDAFPPSQQDQVRTQLGDTLQGIMSQTLLPKAQGKGRVIATEVLINTPAIANLIREGQVSQIYSMLQAGGSLGMHTLDQDLKRLVEDGTLALSVAKSFAMDPSTLEGVRVRPRDYDAEAWSVRAPQPVGGSY
ncbi:type IV pilus twitching motility protein PilT [Microbacterium terricola]|uniref:Twitching motility protein PilT n=1 Tax=Microbacterium terricola TaxID=344163 RepID=A0ABM8DXP5_9MICO|nr:type IV pilus twitching motility protein PilT [Microbacterium terricola]UYK38941.1 type IV pilus twitching motility protein PilT [Microbacterium terricola]BDV30359.1 twitching motility protein PilT [Microbacterium terricola]